MIATDEELYAICNIAKKFKEDLPELEKDALKILLDVWINKLVQRQIATEK